MGEGEERGKSEMEGIWADVKQGHRVEKIKSYLQECGF